MQDILRSGECIPQQLAQWMGERSVPPCQQCSACRDQAAPPLALSQPTLEAHHIVTVRELALQTPRVFHTAQQLTRFLCGIPSPALRHRRLTDLPEFSALKAFPYDEVMSYAAISLS